MDSILVSELVTSSDVCPSCYCVHHATHTDDGQPVVVRYLSPSCSCVCHGHRERAVWRRTTLPAPPQRRVG